MTNTELVRIFEQTIRQKPFSLSENTIKTYLYHIDSLLKFLDNKNIDEITTKDIKKYLFNISSEGVSDTTYNISLAGFKCLYKALRYNPMTEDIIQNNPTIDIPSIKNAKQKKKTPLNEIEKQALLHSCKNVRDYAILVTYLNVGLRVHELVNLTLEQYLNRGENGEIKLVVNKGSYDDEYIFINEQTEKAIDNYIKNLRKDCGCKYLFVSNQGNQMTPSCISKTIKTLARRSGKFSEDRIAQLSNHIMRHTMATDLVNENVPIDVVAMVLRHHSLATVMTYAKTDKERVMEAVR